MSMNDMILEWMKTSEDCKSCPLYGSKVVLWERLYEEDITEAGCDILFVGINPGKDEAIQGRPFIGKSGKLLRERIKALDLSKYKIAFTNAILCSTSNESKIPDIEACISSCRKYTDAIMKMLKPKVIVPVGKQCANVYFEIPGGMSAINGKPVVNVIPIVHPSFVIRTQTEQSKAMLDYGLNQVKLFVEMQLT